MTFRTQFAKQIFNTKYKHEKANDWEELSKTLVEDVCGKRLSKDQKYRLAKYHAEMKWIAGGRYLYYAGRPNKFFQNCYMLRAEEDTREDWADLSWKAQRLLMTGGGIGVDYSVYRPRGSKLRRTGGVASGAVSAMKIINNIGREVMQGGSRRSAIYGSLNWRHGDVDEMLNVKNWYDMPIKGSDISIGEAKENDFNYNAPLDITNISLNYDNQFIMQVEKGFLPETFVRNVKQALSTGEPGFSFNFGEKENETLRNACCELTSEDDSDVCNLASLNFSRIEDKEELRDITDLVTKFLICGTIVGDVPYDKVREVRDKNRRLGLGVMGLHEWLIMRGYNYNVNDELREWLQIYKDESDRTATGFSWQQGLSQPKGVRAIAPTGTIGIMAGTTTGIEPLFATAYKRRYLKNGNSWHYQYVIDGTAKYIIRETGVDADEIETAIDLQSDVERRIKFQFEVQKYVDHAISSTINLPKWDTENNNESLVNEYAKTIIKYCHGIRGLTFYPSGARGGQPLCAIDYSVAIRNEGEEFKEEYADICEISGKGGTCGI